MDSLMVLKLGSSEHLLKTPSLYNSLMAGYPSKFATVLVVTGVVRSVSMHVSPNPFDFYI
jgi:hypothetical protein